MSGIGKKKIIQVLGPTGVGKSRVALELAGRIGGEIISADSVQVYKDFDIGTDKLPESERRGISHHLIDILSDCTQFNASIFLELAFNAAEDIIDRGKIPIVCGGTALYLKTMICGIFPENKEKRVTRKQLNRIAERRGLACLYAKLKQVDPEYAHKIGKNDRVRIIRAMEIYYNNGCSPSEIFTRTRTPFADYEFIRIGLNVEREQLYRRIEDRVNRMIDKGLVEEVKRLKAIYSPSCPAFKALGYKEISMYLEDENISLVDAVEWIKQHSRNFAKRQLSWFRQEKNIAWFNPKQTGDIEQFIRNKLNTGP
jgi:tRNA dimethylallyltransferase